MSERRVPQSLLSPGVRDARQEALVEALDAGLQSIDISAFIMSDAMTVDAELLPYMAREFSVEDFLTPGMPDEYVRKFIANAYELHATKGYIEGVRYGLSLLGVAVHWQQWWQQTPPGEHDTHIVTAYATENVFTSEPTLLNSQLQLAVKRVIQAAQRWSQDISFQVGARYKNTVYAGGAFAGMTAQRRTLGFGRPSSFEATVGAGSAGAGLQIMRHTFEGA